MIQISYLNGKYDEIGVNYIIDKLYIHTDFGKEERKNIRIYKSKDIGKLKDELNRVEQIIKKVDENKYQQILLEMVKIKDIRGTLKRCENNLVLDVVEFFEIKNFAITTNKIMKIYKTMDLNLDNIEFKSQEEVVKILDDGKGLNTFHIYNGYSEKISKIRNAKKVIENKIFSEVDYENREKLKEERINIVIEEEEEELKIRKKLTNEIRGNIDKFYSNIKSIGTLDFLLAKGRLAKAYNCSKPIINNNNIIILKNMVNMQVKNRLETKGKKYTEISVNLEDGVTVLTGANMGGKSVALKTTVINVLLSQLGFYIFAQYGEIGIVDYIEFICNDLEEEKEGLSTFGGEIVKLKEIIFKLKRGRGFVILDEFARGTNPKEGSVILKSLIKYLNKLNSTVIIATHLDLEIEGKVKRLEVVGFKNIDLKKMKKKIELNSRDGVKLLQKYMDYTIEEVNDNKEVPKDGINICELLGLEKEIIDVAKEYYKK